MSSYLKWVGGKSKLIGDLIPKFPRKMNKYIEPFVGSASVVLSFMEQTEKISENIFEIEDEFLIPKSFLVNDYNYHLIQCHKVVKERYEEILAMLSFLQQSYSDSGDKAKFYKDKRDELNNIIRKGRVKDENIIMLSSLFIFINKTCFNGIWRVNNNNENNVPWNKNEKTNIFNKRELNTISHKFKKIEFYSMDFVDFVKNNLEKDDFVFLDPPYVPLSETSNFTKYTDKGWGEQDNHRLYDLLKYIDDKKAKFMMTNSDAPAFFDIFDKNGWEINMIKAHRFVKPMRKRKGCEIQVRKRINETITTNY